ncbi:trypsin-like peptidase domain-containing protein [Methylocystis sp. S23]
MNMAIIERIIVRHLSGTKANQIEQLPLGDRGEFTIGRDPSSAIAFDPAGDSVVSRKHAVIRLEGAGDNLKFKLSDAGSSNGTFLNGERVAGEVEIFPEDKIELGQKGPAFVFDVQPRPANFAGRTQVIGAADAAATRLIKSAETAISTAVSASTAVTDEAPSVQQKIGVGQETVQRLLGEERGKANRTLTGVIAAVVAFFLIGGAALFWKQRHDLQEKDEEARFAQRETEERLSQIPDDVNRKIGMKPIDIYNKYANATVEIRRLWRLYDKQTGKPLQHKTVIFDGKLYPAYVRLPGNLGIVRWLTLEDEAVTNLKVGGEGSGSGFVVGEQGFILTNKHVAAPWLVRYGSHGDDIGVLYDYAPPSKKRAKPKAARLINITSAEFSKVYDWIPESGGYIFRPDVPTELAGNTPDPTTNDKGSFVGRDDTLEVQFHGSRLSVNAELVRSSPDSDAALIKINSPQTLIKTDLATDDTVSIGENVIVLGYPAISVENKIIRNTEEAGRIRTVTDVLTEATVTEGIVSKLATGVKATEGGTFASDIGDAIQLGINTTGSGNSGGPVFNASGKVIGLFTYGRQRDGAAISMAVPIKYGRELLQAQKQ